MQKITRFTAEERDNLTAYLDGELEEGQVTEIERKLATSEVARREVEILSRTWDMLNLLPRVNVSEEFSRQTMSIAKQSEGQLLLDKSKVWLVQARRVVFVAVWGVALCAAGMIGFQITNRLIPDESRLLVEELPIIENIDNYREVGDVEFLRQLKSSRVFQEESSDASSK
jgi:anti-sigma factor RsiW